jgi:bacterioferritin (cytochrome b1)
MDTVINISKADIAKAYYNSYRLITNKISFEDLLKDDDINERVTFLAHNPNVEITSEIIQEVIDYFAEEEDYEICSELKQVMDRNEK